MYHSLHPYCAWRPWHQLPHSTHISRQQAPMPYNPWMKHFGRMMVLQCCRQHITYREPTVSRQWIQMRFHSALHPYRYRIYCIIVQSLINSRRFQTYSKGIAICSPRDFILHLVLHFQMLFKYVQNTTLQTFLKKPLAVDLSMFLKN